MFRKGFICAIICAMFLESIVMGSELISVDALLQKSGLLEADVSKERVEEMIRHYRIKEEDTVGFSENELRASILDILESAFENDYSYLLDASALKAENINFEEIKRIGVFSRNEVEIQSLLVDLETGQYYYDAGSLFLSDISSAEKTGGMTESFITEIKRIVSNIDLKAWNQEYKGSIDREVRGIVVCFEINDDVFVYSTDGYDNYAPDNYYDTEYELLKLFW